MWKLKKSMINTNLLFFLLRSPESQGIKGEKESHCDWCWHCSESSKKKISMFFVCFVSHQAQEEEDDDDGEMYEDLDERWWDDMKKIFE